MQDNIIEAMVKQVAESLHPGTGANIGEPSPSMPKKSVQSKPAKPQQSIGKQNAGNMKSGLTLEDYPLAKKKTDRIKGLTGKGLHDITLDKVMQDQVKPEDIRISGEVLNMQADIAEGNGKRQFAENLRRAAEMTVIPDERVLEIYNMLRPNRATKEQLSAVADELQQEYGAKLTAKFVRDAISVYEQRGILLK